MNHRLFCRKWNLLLERIKEQRIKNSEWHLNSLLIKILLTFRCSFSFSIVPLCHLVSLSTFKMHTRHKLIAVASLHTMCANTTERAKKNYNNNNNNNNQSVQSKQAICSRAIEFRTRYVTRMASPSISILPRW
jgi:hypothetical protein